MECLDTRVESLNSSITDLNQQSKSFDKLLWCLTSSLLMSIQCSRALIWHLRILNIESISIVCCRGRRNVFDKQVNRYKFSNRVLLFTPNDCSYEHHCCVRSESPCKAVLKGDETADAPYNEGKQIISSSARENCIENAVENEKSPTKRQQNWNNQWRMKCTSFEPNINNKIRRTYTFKLCTIAHSKKSWIYSSSVGIFVTVFASKISTTNSVVTSPVRILQTAQLKCVECTIRVNQ